jgi:threonine dehydratase
MHSEADAIKHSTPGATSMFPLRGFANVLLKDETSQISRAFKYRGAFAKLEKIDTALQIVTASTGNHGIAVAQAAAQLGHSVHVFLPTQASQYKARLIESLGARVSVVGDQLDGCTIAAKQWAETIGALWISGFDDRAVVEGYREVFREIKLADPSVKRLFVPVGGGGLLAAAILEGEQSWEIVGVQSDAAKSMQESLALGAPVRIEPCKSVAGGLLVPQVGQIAYELCAVSRPRLVSVSDAELVDSMRTLWIAHGIRSEAAGAATLAAALREDRDVRCVCIISGGNIDPLEHSRLLSTVGD